MKTTSKFLFIILGFVFLAAIRVRAQSFIWADQITSAAKTVGNKLAADSDGNVYVTGGFSGKIGFGITNLAAIGGQDIFLAVGEGFVEITGDHVAILTDMAIKADDIDEAKAEEARRRAEARLAEHIDDGENAIVSAALANALAQIHVKRRRR